MDFKNLSPNDIQELRVKLGWCRSELALKLNVDLETIYKWESGQSAPSLPETKIIEGIFLKSETALLDLVQSSRLDAD